MKLIERMHAAFKNDAEFQTGLRALGKGSAAESLKRGNLDPLRNGAVFHFLPERFSATLEQATCNECPFIEGEGANKSVYYPFADVIATEMLVGFASDDDKFDAALTDAMVRTRDMLLKFALEAESLIVVRLKGWGFQLET